MGWLAEDGWNLTTFTDAEILGRFNQTNVFGKRWNAGDHAGGALGKGS